MPASSCAGSSRGTPKKKTGQKLSTSLSSNASALMEDLTEVALNELMELCRKDPTKIQACIHLARTATVKAVPEGQEKDFHETYTKFYKVPK